MSNLKIINQTSLFLKKMTAFLNKYGVIVM